jgi:hypothetical protein
VSDKKSEHRISDSFRDDSYFGGESREQMLEELRVRGERFYERASREQSRKLRAWFNPFWQLADCCQSKLEKDQLNLVLARRYNVT